MKKGVVLFSSGIDSFITREYLIKHGHDIDCLYFQHGGRYSETELIKIKQMPFEVKIDNTLYFKEIEREDAFIPNRNVLMSVTANSLGYDTIWLGGSRSDRVCDNNESVFNQLSQFLTTMNGRYIKIDSPFWDVYKDDMVRWYINNEDPFKLINYTFSCYTPLNSVSDIKYKNMLFSSNKDFVNTYKTFECMQCSACFRKCAALWGGARIFIPFKNIQIADKYTREFMKCLVQTPRSISTIDYVNQLYEWNKLQDLLIL